jgi:hypothetical protein
MNSENREMKTTLRLFKKLGWAGAPLAQALELPLGTPEQRQAALPGLMAPARWWDWGERDANGHHERVSHVGGHERMLALFAIRVGVGARRALDLLHDAACTAPVGERAFPPELLTAVLAERGPAFAQKIVNLVYTVPPRFTLAELPGDVAVRLVHAFRLALPENPAYIADWARFSAETLAGEADPANAAAQEAAADRFGEHIRLGLALGVGEEDRRSWVMHSFGELFPLGVRRGLIDRDEAVELAMGGLDVAPRPIDRKGWLAVLDRLDITDEELAERADALIPLLAVGDPGLVERLAPKLIALSDDVRLVQVLAVSLAVRTAKGKRIVLAAAANRRRPHGVEDVAPQLEELTADRDKGVARLARALVERWEVSASPTVEDQTPAGLWQPVPDVWRVPRFERGPTSAEALTNALAELIRRPEVGLTDVAVERFLALANAVARDDMGAACAALAGARRWNDISGLHWVPTFLAEAGPAFGVGKIDWWPRWAEPVVGLLPARESAVFRRLGQVPCLLSEPSTVDLGIDPTDLADRLEEYLAAGATASEPDLLLSLTRLKPADAAVLARLDALTVPVVTLTGEPTGLVAGPAAADYLRDPLLEPTLEPLEAGMGGLWAPTALDPAPSAYHPGGAEPQKPADQHPLWRAGSRLVSHGGVAVPFSFGVFPHWGDVAYLGIRWHEHEGVSLGLRLRQAARRSSPLTPGAAMNMLAIQRYVKPRAAADAALAVAEAWERGLLRPGVPDLAYLDWQHQHLKDLAALVAVLRDLAQAGMLALVWPLLDQLALASARAPRLLAGTVEAVEAIREYLPEALAAVAAGTAKDEALDLPGIRQLIARGGSSRAVTVAREVVAKLPPPPAPNGASDSPDRPEAGKPEPAPTATRGGQRQGGGTASSTGQPFDEIWPEDAGGLPAIDDGVKVTAEWLEPRYSWRPLGFVLALPVTGHRRYLVLPHFFEWDLDGRGSIDALPVPPDCDDLNEVAWSEKVWLYWEEARGRLSDSPEPLPVKVDDRWPPKNPMPCPPLSNSLVTVALATPGLPGNDGRDGERLVKSLARQGKIGSQGARAAAWTLLRSSPLDPGRLARPLERTPALLPYLWPWLTESVAFAAQQEGPLPRWLLSILGTAEFYAPHLAEAARRGLVPADAAAWPGLAELASRPGKSLTLAKARNLRQVLGLDPA